MLGAFGATTDQISWVLTSYIVSAAVVMPLTGYLSTWLGRRRLLLVAICGFVLSSALCGMAWNLESMVVFRLAQGIFGAPLVPLSQAILLDAFPRERHGQALAIFGLGIMVAPVIGPAFGGYLTEIYSGAWCSTSTCRSACSRCCSGRLSAAARHQGHQDRLGRHGAVGARGRRPAIRARSGPDARLVQLPSHRCRDNRHRVHNRGVLSQGLEQAGQHHRPVAAEGPQFRHRHAGDHSLRHQPVRLDGADAAVQSAAARLSRRQWRALCSFPGRS